MMDTTIRLDELLGKGSSITDKQAKEAATLLLSLYSETQDESKAAEYLMKFNTKVCSPFFEAAVRDLDPETQIQPIHSAMCSTKAYIANVRYAATDRGFRLAAILIKNDLSIARNVLTRTIADAEKAGQFDEKVVNKFKEHVVKYCGSLEPIKALGEQPWSNPVDQRRFIRFIEQAVPGSDSSAAIGSASELLQIISSASKEAAVLFQSLSDNNGIIAALRKDVSDREARIADLQRRFDESQQTTRENEAHIADLSMRLKNSLQMDNISQSQELITLKSNLQNSLKVEYADYFISRDSECNPDTYGALIGSLARIFKTLRRYGIIIEKER